MTHVLLQGQKFQEALAVNLELVVTLLNGHITDLTERGFIDLRFAGVGHLGESGTTERLKAPCDVLTACRIEVDEFCHRGPRYIARLLVRTFRSKDLAWVVAVGLSQLTLKFGLTFAQLFTNTFSCVEVKAKT